MIGFGRNRAHGFVKRLASAFAAAALVAGAGVLAQVPRPVAIDLGAVRALVPALERPEGRLLSLKGVGAALGWRLTSSPDGGFELDLGLKSAVLRFSEGVPSIVQGPRTFWGLGAEPLTVEGDLFLPRSAVEVVRQAAASVARGGPGAARTPSLALEQAAAGEHGGTLRLRITPPAGSVAGPPEVSRGARDGRWIVRLTGAIAPEAWPWRGQRIGHPLLRSLSVRPGPERTVLVLEAGPALERLTAEVTPDATAWLIALGARPDAAPPRTAARPFEEDRREVRRIVLDPGHGGEEDGAIGPRGVVEKELVLDVARRVRAKLRTRGFEVRLTREGDVGLPLDARAGIANREKADLFVSIHANAARYRGARGAETYFLAREATDDAARTAAALENNASRARLDGARDGDLPLILWDMAQTEYLEESQQLAELIQARLNDRVNLEDRGVRQAPFRVLIGATCPAVLVELGFLSHPKEEALLEQPSYRDRLALALAEAVQQFARAREGAPAPDAERFR
jgi:N-acetylmuramoyl-L-alanine amidase